MKTMRRNSGTGLIAVALTGLLLGCGGGTSSPPAATTYMLTVNSAQPSSGVVIAATRSDSSLATQGTTSFSQAYPAGVTATLTAPASASGNKFSSWTGCTTAAAQTCTIVMNAAATIVANYAAAVSVTVTPNPVTINTGATQQFTATITGTPTNASTWAVNGISGGSDTVGTISATGLYVTPFPAPASVNITATSVDDPTASGTAVANLVVPKGQGPGLAVDAAAGQHPINPLIYGMNAYSTGNFEAMADDVRLPLDRWGGDAATRYNYLIDTYDSASDYYYEAYPSSNAYPNVSAFNLEVQRDQRTSSKTLGTMPLIGWTTKVPATNPVCGFSVTKYGTQQKTDPYHADCGNGVKADGSNLTGNDPNDTSFAVDETFTTGWMQYLTAKFGTASAGGIPIYDLDNEPEYWGFVHRDVHPNPLSYDELTTKGITYARAIKAVDPTAAVSGPVISSWDGYFYSPKDWVNGWGTGPDYVYNGNPVDRLAHGDIPLMDYYLQHFKAAEATGGVRLLDYVDIHAYFAASGAAFNPAGATDLQSARLNSTRAFWDPTYTDSNYTDPNNRTKTASPIAPMLVPRLRAWVAADYPGTKLAIDEYNWGAQDHINGAVAQADILGIFGREGLDLGALWGAPDPATQQPSVNAFKVFRNYDGGGAGFGDTGVSATSVDQTKLAIYAALRTADSTLTVVVINKSFGDLTSTISLSNVTPTGPAKVYSYSNANLSAIVQQPDMPVSAGSITTTFPAQSITVFAVPE